MKYRGLTTFSAVLAIGAVTACSAFGGVLNSVSRGVGLGVTAKAPNSVPTVSSNGVTKARLGDLYRDSTLVVDVDISKSSGIITNLVAGNSIVIEHIDEGTLRISYTGAVVSTGDYENLSNKAMTAYYKSVTNHKDIVGLRLSDEFLSWSNRSAHARLDNIQTNMTFVHRDLTNLSARTPYVAPVEAWSTVWNPVPVIRIRTDDGGFGFFLLCTDGMYRSCRDVESGRYTMMFDVKRLYGREFTAEYLTGNLGYAVWREGFTFSASTAEMPLSVVCDCEGFPRCFGLPPTPRDVVYDLLRMDRSLWNGFSDIEGRESDYVGLDGIDFLVGRIDQYARAAHSAIAQLSYDLRFTEDNLLFKEAVIQVLTEYLNPSTNVVQKSNGYRLVTETAADTGPCKR